MFSLKQEASITKEAEVTFVEINQTIPLNHFIIYGLYDTNGNPTGLYFIDAWNSDTDVCATWSHTDKQNMFPSNLVNKFDVVFEQEFKNNKVYSPAIVTTKFNYADNIYKRINKLAPQGAITEPIIGIKHVLLNSSLRIATQTICSAKKASVVLYTRDTFIVEFDAHFYKCSISPLFKDTTIKIYSFDSGQTIHVPVKYPWYKLEEKLISIW